MPSDIIRDFSVLYKSCERAGELVAKMKPEVVVLFTLHGLALTSGAYAVYAAEVARGNALWNDCCQNFEGWGRNSHNKQIRLCHPRG